MTNDHLKVLLIDDQWARPEEPIFRERYGRLPFDWCYATAEEHPGVYSVSQGLNAIRENSPAVILLDLRFNEQDHLGIDILEAIRSEYPTLPVLIFTSVSTEEQRELMIRCIELGANEYIEKSTTAKRLESVVSMYGESRTESVLWGNSTSVRQLRATLARVSFSGSTNVLIQGESGTGKELVASTVHRLGMRRASPFVAKNCAHCDSQLLESELFGHARGSYTGAIRDRKGLFEEADHGTLFLDEVADIPTELQAKLLRVLESRSFRRTGENQEIQSDFQLICATNRPLDELVDKGTLRSDFYYRVAGLTIQVPPLRQRGGDILMLAELFLRRLRDRGAAGYPGQFFSKDSQQYMLSHSWPGNVRELRNFVERSLILSTNHEINVPSAAGIAPRGVDPTDVVPDFTSMPATDSEWAKTRIRTELEMCLKAKSLVQTYKGTRWRAEFMRLMYPQCRASNAKGLSDLVKRLTQGPWGYPRWEDDVELRDLINELMR